MCPQYDVIDAGRWFLFKHLLRHFKLIFQMQIEGFRATLDDIVLMHLSAFVYDNQKTTVPLNLEINLADTQITIRVSIHYTFSISKMNRKN